MPYTLTAEDAGYFILATGTGNVTFPDSVIPAGACVTISANSGGDNIQVTHATGFAYAGSNVAAINLGDNQSVSIVSQGAVSLPIVFSGGLRSSPNFGASLAANGWQKLPSGLIIQWGSGSYSGGSSAITFPVAFPNAVFGVTTGADGSSALIEHSTPYSLTKTGFLLSSVTQSQSGGTWSSANAFITWWLAFGN